MKSFLVATLFAGSSVAWFPSCAWNDCMSGVDLGDCKEDSGWACLCGDQDLVSQLNTCVATSCTNETDQEAIYGAVAQLCVNNGVTITNSEQATFSATSGGSLTQITAAPSGWGPGGNWDSADWSSWISSCSGGLGGPPGGWKSGDGPWGSHGGWGGPGGRGGGPGGFGPWGTKASGVNCDAWTTWTAGWGSFSSWTGTWSGCSSTTASPVGATVTTTVTGSDGSTQVLTGTTFGIQAVESDSGAGPIAVHVSTSRGLGLFAALAAGVFGAMVAL